MNVSRRRLVRDLGVAHRVTTVPRQGWGGLPDKELLEKIPPEFDVWITMDSNLSYQQNLAGCDILLIVLRAPNNRYESLKPLIPTVLEKIQESGATSGSMIVVGT